MWLSNFRVVLAETVLAAGSVRIEDGVLAEIRDAPVEGAALDGGGLLLLPGFVDMHGDMIETALQPRPSVQMPMDLALRDLDRGLAAAGVTTAYAAVSFSPNAPPRKLRSFEHTVTTIRALCAARHNLAVDHRVHTRFDITHPKALSTVEGLIAEGAVDLISLMDHTPGQGQYRNLERFVDHIAQSRSIDRVAAATLVANRIERRRVETGDLAETLRAIADACRAHGLPLASHDDDTVEKVALMESLGVTIAEFPVTEGAAAEARRRGMATAMGAPNALRGESYSGNLSARAAYDAGVLDILAADYHPSAILPAVLALGGDTGLARATRLATAAPAKALGLADRGRIAPGLRADLVIADDSGIGHIRATLRAGREIFSDGSLTRLANRGPSAT